MGGPGSGNRYRWSSKSTVESCRAIDVRRWKRDGLLSAGAHFSCYWTNYDGTRASISVHVEPSAVVLVYRCREGDNEWEDVEQRIPLSRTDCNLGGERPWFLCSVYSNGVYCGRRVAKLYGAGSLFACRRCYDLAYQSQHEPPHGRALHRAQKIRLRLGGSASSVEPFPDKPKGMHWRTYWRWMEKHDALDQRSLVLLGERFGWF